jgi:hypothetical protein
MGTLLYIFHPLHHSLYYNLTQYCRNDDHCSALCSLVLKHTGYVELRWNPPRLYWERIHLFHFVIPCVTPHLPTPCYVGALIRIDNEPQTRVMKQRQCKSLSNDVLDNQAPSKGGGATPPYGQARQFGDGSGDMFCHGASNDGQQFTAHHYSTVQESERFRSGGPPSRNLGMTISLSLTVPVPSASGTSPWKRTTYLHLEFCTVPW